MDIEFNSLQELFKRIKPALTTRVRELYRLGYDYLKEEDIWNYLKTTNWRDAKDLSLAEMVNDILEVDEFKIDRYMKDKLKVTTRSIYLEKGDQIDENESTINLSTTERSH